MALACNCTKVMLSKIFEPFNFAANRTRDKAEFDRKFEEEMATTPLEKTLLKIRQDEEKSRILRERELHKGVVWKTMKKVGTPSLILRKNDIIMNEHGMQFLMVDPVRGVMIPLNWEDDQYKFTPIASTPEEGMDEVLSDAMEEEELYDITPEDRKKLRHGGII